MSKLCFSYVKTANNILKNGFIRNMSTVQSMTPRHKPTYIDKLALVWTKKFKSIAEIPEHVTAETIERARSEARIKLSNRLMIMTALASFGAILAGKSAAKKGESVHQQNLDWHKQYNEDYDKKETAKSQS